MTFDCDVVQKEGMAYVRTTQKKKEENCPPIFRENGLSSGYCFDHQKPASGLNGPPRSGALRWGEKAGEARGDRRYSIKGDKKNSVTIEILRTIKACKNL